MKKLFIIGIGGSSQKANIEVHDVQFVITDTIENSHEVLIDGWYGDALHIDTYAELKGADGYAIEIHDEPQQREVNLYFVHLGGYLMEIFGEQHEYGFFVAKTEKEAKDKAKTTMLKHIKDIHADGVFNMEKSLKFADGKTAYIHLIPDGCVYQLLPDWNGYKKIK